MMHSEIDLYL